MQVNRVLSDLDQIRAFDWKNSKRQTARARHIDLSRIDNTAPLVSVYQSTIDVDWFVQEIENKGLEDELMLFDDVSGLTEDEEHKEDTNEPDS